MRHHADGFQRPVARAAHQAAVGDAVGDVGERRHGQALAGEHVRDPGRVGRQRLGRDPALRGGEGDHLLPGQERLARRELGRAPGRRLGERRQRLLLFLASRSQACSSASTSRAPVSAARSPIPNTATTTFSAKSSRLMSSCSRISARDPVAGRTRAADVDHEPERVVGVHAGAADDPLVEDVEPGHRADPVAQHAQRAHGLGQQLLAADRRLAPGRVKRGGEDRVRARGLDQGHGAVDDPLVDAIAGAEVEDRRLGDRADDLVHGREHDVGAALQRRGRQRRREVHVGAPRLVDDQRHPARVGDLGERRDVGDGAEVGRRDDHRRDRVGLVGQRGVELLRGQAVRHAELRVELRGHEPRAQARQHEAVDGRGVDVALHHHPLAEMGEGEADRVVAARAAVDQEPAAPRPPGLGRQSLRERERHLGGIGPDVDALDAGRQVELEQPVAERLAQGRVRARAALVAGHVKPAGVAIGVRDHRVEVRGRVLLHGRPR